MMKATSLNLWKKLIALFLLVGLISLQAVSQVTKSRLTPAQIAEVMTNLDKDLQAEIKANGGKLDLKLIQEDLEEEVLEEFLLDKEARVEELEEFRRNFDQLAAQKNLKLQDKVAGIKELVKITLEKGAKLPAPRCMKPLESCDINPCCGGLVCATEPQGHELQVKTCGAVGKSCKADTDCCSNKCDIGLNGKKQCKAVSRCYQPQKLGSTCNKNPVCGGGAECIPFSLETNGLNVCKSNGQSCSSDSACCSNSCNKGKCENNFVCKDCVKHGEKIKRGRKCCEGLMRNADGVCIPDAPPLIIYNKFQKYLNTLLQSAVALSQDDNGQGFINSNQGQFKNKGAQSLSTGLNVNTNQVNQGQKEIPAFSVQKGSDFKTCDIDFRKDYLIQMKQKKVPKTSASLLDIEASLIGFEYVALGENYIKDFWKGPGIVNGPLNQRLQEIAKKSRKNREEIYEDIADSEIKTKCLCMYALGPEKLESEEFKEKKKFFKESCPKESARMDKEIKRLEALGDNADKLGGDASGIKQKLLMTEWSSQMTNFQMKLLTKNTDIFKQMDRLSLWALEKAPWNDAQDKKYKLFNFTVKNYKNTIGTTIGAGVAGALLAAGVIAVLGGFGAAATLTAWASIGIISASAVTGATGGWLLASLKGAWLAKAPEVKDKVIRRSYKCGKKTQCTDFQRTLHQPFNKVCNAHVSANSCIKSVVVYRGDKQKPEQFLIDPWIPKGIEYSSIVKDKRNYVSLLDASFKKALPYLNGKKKMKDPKGGTIKTHVFLNYYNVEPLMVIDLKPTGQLGEGYLQKPFLDEKVVGLFAPKLLAEKTYLLEDSAILAIKEGAKKYAIEENFFLETQVANLDTFAEFVFEWHFLWPRLSPVDRIAYPMPALVSYLELLTFGFEAASRGNQALGLGFNELARQQLQDLQNTIARFDLENDVGLSESTLGDEANRLARSISVAGLALSGSGGEGNLTGDGNLSGDSNAGLDGGGLSTADNARNAIAALDESRERKNERLALFKEQVGDTERGKGLLEASSNLRNGFFNPTQRSDSGTSLPALAAVSTPSKGSNAVQTILKDKNSENTGDLKFDNGSNSATSGYTAPTNSADYLFGAEEIPTGQTEGERQENAESLRNAINAVEDEDPSKYKGKEQDGLFEKITKAYFRNYRRVLNIRKKINFNR